MAPTHSKPTVPSNRSLPASLPFPTIDKQQQCSIQSYRATATLCSLLVRSHVLFALGTLILALFFLPVIPFSQYLCGLWLSSRFHSLARHSLAPCEQRGKPHQPADQTFRPHDFPARRFLPPLPSPNAAKSKAAKQQNTRASPSILPSVSNLRPFATNRPPIALVARVTQPVARGQGPLQETEQENTHSSQKPKSPANFCLLFTCHNWLPFRFASRLLH